jgi:hypothetical protein
LPDVVIAIVPSGNRAEKFPLVAGTQPLLSMNFPALHKAIAAVLKSWE